MFARKIEKYLLEWKQTPDKMPLVIKGCRQCGKTYSVTHFARRAYAHVVYLDFFEHPEYKQLFAQSLDVNTLVMNITSVVQGAVFEQGKTCLILDEIQECPKARMSLKFWKLDGRYDVIATGSLLGVNGYRTLDDNTPIPVGYEHIVDMYPLDFEEWLWANEVPKATIDYLNQSVIDVLPVSDAIHQRMNDLLRQYMVVGGMPRAVTAFFETHNLQEVYRVQHAILDEYRTDMTKYANTGDRPRIIECFDSIPLQLSSENKKFTFAQVRRGGRGRDYIASLQWIEDAGIIRRCYNVSIPQLPLLGNAIRDNYKVYMADIGLLMAMLGQGTAAAVLQGELLGYKGAIYENLLADILGKAGRRLYYYRKDSGLELDFLIDIAGQCVPIECKAESGNAKSLKTVMAHPEKYAITRAVKLGHYNIGCVDNITTMPMYMAFFYSSPK